MRVWPTSIFKAIADFKNKEVGAFKSKPAPSKTLCTVTFLYTMKGVVGSDRPKTETVFAWVNDGCTNKDCVVLFKPKGTDITRCTIKEIIVVPIETVTHAE